MSSLREEIREWLQKLETVAARPELAVPEIKLVRVGRDLASAKQVRR